MKGPQPQYIDRQLSNEQAISFQKKMVIDSIKKGLNHSIHGWFSNEQKD
jgi:hypothetical protein